MRASADLAKIFSGHVTQGLSSDSMMSYDWQVVLSRKFTQQIAKLSIHSRLLKKEEHGLNDTTPQTQLESWRIYGNNS